MALKIRFYSDAYKPKRASHRLRGELTAYSLADQGYDSKILTDWSEVDRDTIVIFLKRSMPASIQRAKDLGAKTVYDLCDNKFDEKEEYGPNCQLVDVVSVNSVNMGISTLENTGRRSVVMPDPFERRILEPKFNPGHEMQLLWFGSQSSLGFLPIVEMWKRLEAEVGNYRFHMIMSKPDRVWSKMRKRADKGEITGVNFNRLTLYEWTWDLQGELLDKCDMVVMPVVVDNYRTETKSANRVIDSLASGRYVITSPLASYLEFSPYTWQDPDYIAGIKDAFFNPEKTLEKIRAGQKYTIENFSAEKLSKNWIEEILKELGWEARMI
ncbi:MAG: hypothetical protein RLZZ196_118 [Bacteroidota bacterium]|jgi:glycosyltransferase involved in cell wall biosynthesis